MRFYWLLVSTLAVWRVTHLLSAEDGPWNAVVWIRRKAGSGFFANLLDCFYCLSLWIAAPFAFFVGETIKERFYLWLAFSAGAILLDRVTSKEPVPPIYIDNGAKDDAMLRTGENSAEDDNAGA